MERYEDRLLLSTFLVTNNSDDPTKANSLPWAISQANADTSQNVDTIAFGLPADELEIDLASGLTISHPVLIDATREAGYAFGTTMVQVNGSTNVVAGDGLVLASGSDGSTIEGLDIVGFLSGAGIRVESTGDLIESNLLGVTTTGTNGANQVGVVIDSAASTTIGGTTTAAANEIGFNTTAGVEIVGTSTGDDTNALVEGNEIGTDSTGTVSLGNGAAVQVFNASDNTIGGTASGAANIIGHNTNSGITILSGTGNTILANTYTGTNGSVQTPSVAADDIALVVGANGNLQPPQLRSASQNNTTLSIALEVVPSVATSLDVYGLQANQRTFLGDASVPANSTSATLMVSSNLTGDQIVVTQTNATDGTSAFSAPLTVTPGTTVTNTQDSGPGSLRDAISTAESNGDSEIIFDIPGTGPFTIALQSPLVVDTTLTIDGTTELTSQNTPDIVLSPSVGGATSGIELEADGSTIKGLEFSGFSGPDLIVGSGSNTIGGTSFGAGNVLGTSSSAGVSITGASNVLEGNFIGTDATGDDLGNAEGVIINNGGSNTIGGTVTGAGNTVAFNSSAGVSISGSSAVGNVVAGNYVGTDAAGSDLRNGSGVVLFDDQGNTVGGTTLGAVNIIGFNSGAGILLSGSSGDLVWGNYIGTDSFNDKMGNGTGIEIDGSSSNSIGGTVGGTVDPAQEIPAWFSESLSYSGSDSRGGSISGTAGAVSGIGNVIDFNQGAGIAITQGDGQSTDNVILGNLIGVNVVSAEVGTDTPTPLIENAGNLGDGVDLSDTGTQSNSIGFALGFSYTPTSIGGTITSQLNLADAFSSGTTVLQTFPKQVFGAGQTLSGTVAVGNLITANSGDGVSLSGSVSQNVVVGNTIGATTTIAGNTTNPLSGNAGNGIAIANAMNNTIGDVSTSSVGSLESLNAGANVISGNAGNGIVISPGSTTGNPNLITGNLVARNNQNGIELIGDLSGVQPLAQISDNFIGTTLDGTSTYDANGEPQGNVLSGILLESTSASSVQGSTIAVTLSGNVVSGNGLSGATVSDSTTGAARIRIEDNLIGTDKMGEHVLAASSTNSPLSFGNANDGILLDNVTGVTIGGTVSASVSLSLATTGGNLIAGNLGQGIELDNAAGDTISGNLIGVVLNPNGQQVEVSNIVSLTSGGTLIGGSGNLSDGILVDNSAGDVINGNLIAGNVGQGIELDNAASNTISGNLIGVVLSLTGQNPQIAAADANSSNAGNLSDGVFVLNSTGDVILGNLISNNGGYGIDADDDIAPAAAIDLLIASNFIGTTDDGTSEVDANGASLGNGADGVFLDSVSQVTLGGKVTGLGNVISGNHADGVDLLDASAILIVGNNIGTDAGGSSIPGSPTSDLGNDSDGIFINQSSSITVGGITNSARNIISGNHTDGVFISGTSSTTSNENLIEGNWIGVGESSGQAVAVPNANAGIILSNADDNIIGGLTTTPGTGPGNVVSGNLLDGIVLVNDAEGNKIEGDLIGTSPTGSSAISNSADGIFLLGSGTIKGVTSNPTPSTISGTTIESNVIAGNNEDGVQIFGAGATGNTLSRNWIGISTSGSPIANSGDGVLLDQAGPLNLVGGAGQGNFISGNDQAGVAIMNSPDATNGTIVEGNDIGTDATGSGPVGNGAAGVLIYDASASTIGGTSAGASNVISGNAQAGVQIFNPGGTNAAAAGNLVLGNFIGTNAAGASALGNGSNGVQIDNGSDNIIGGTATADRNVISGNQGDGVLIDQSAVGNQLLGNLIGTNAAGTSELGNGSNGVQIDNGSENTIGGIAAADRNVISGNHGNGVLIDQFPDLSAAGNQVLGNFIGTNAGGTTALSNMANGLALIDGSANTIGGTASGAGNVIAGNLQWGILIQITVTSAGSTQSAVEGNDIGLDASRSYAIGNSAGGIFVNNVTTQLLGQTIGGSVAGAGNLISGNANVGIELSGPQTTVSGTNNVIQANLIGLNAAGQVVDLPDGTSGNATGILASNSPDNLIGGTTTTDRNVIAGNSAVGIELSDTSSTGNLILGNFIGTNLAGNAFPSGSNEAVPAQEVGVLINGASSDTVGQAGAGNVVSGNAIGVELAGVLQSNSQFAGSNNVVAGNLIGTDATGTQPVSNLDLGVDVDNSSGNTIGPGNVISANGIAGVEIVNSGSQQNLVTGNHIGESINGGIFSSRGRATIDLNGAESGIQVFADAQNNGVVILGASQNTIGDDKQLSGSAPNTISGNVQVGVYITSRDFQLKVYLVPVNNVVSGNTIQSDGIYGVLFYDAPKNKDRPFTGANPMLFKNLSGAEKIAFSNFESSFDAGTFLPTSSSGKKPARARSVTVRHQAAPKARIEHQPHPQGPARHRIPAAASETRHTTTLAARRGVSTNHRKHPG